MVRVNDLFYYYREQAALKARQYQRALDDIVKAIELSPKDLTYRAEHAVVNLRVGRYEESMKILNEILKDEPKYAEAYRLLGLCQIQLKKTDEACGNFNKAKKELGDPNVDELIKRNIVNKRRHSEKITSYFLFGLLSSKNEPLPTSTVGRGSPFGDVCKILSLSNFSPLVKVQVSGLNMIYRFDSFFCPVYKLNAAVYGILHLFFIFFSQNSYFFSFYW